MLWRHGALRLPCSPRGLLMSWPRTVGVMQQVPFSRPFRKRHLLAMCEWAGLQCRRKRFRNDGNRVCSMAALDRLAGLAARDPRSNSYHHTGHVMHVVMAAGLLASRAGLKRRERELLVLAALVHDLDHHGRRAARCPRYRQEDWSAGIVARCLMRQRGDRRLCRHLGQLIRATVLNDKKGHAGQPGHPDCDFPAEHDVVACLLTDADVFASLAYDRVAATRLTGCLKLEQRLAGGAADLLSCFVDRVMELGLRSEAGRELLHEVMVSRRPGRNAPKMSRPK